MKKAIMNTILSLIATIDTPEAEAVRNELTAELAKDQARKDANAQTYELVKPLVFENLTADTPVTLAELWEAVKDDVPGDFTKGKLQHAMTRVWVDELEKHEGKVNSYTLKA